MYSPSYDGLMVEINSSVSFVCEGGMRFKDDVDKPFENATCKENNTWTEIDGAGCHASKSFLGCQKRVQLMVFYFSLILQGRPTNPGQRLGQDVQLRGSVWGRLRRPWDRL